MIRLSLPTAFEEQLIVKDRPGERCLFIGELCQSKALLDRAGNVTPEQPWDLIRIMALWGTAWVMHREKEHRSGNPTPAPSLPPPPSALIAGLGGGSVSRALASLLPAGSRLDSVEIDSAVARAATDWMGYEPDGEYSCIHVADGRAFIRDAGASRRWYDLIYLDMFTGTGIAKQVTGTTFLKKAR